jgi:plasmid stabilization system protein ParE
LIWQALQILKNHPEIGRPAALAPYRELVISRGKSGYLALYKFDSIDDSILVLAIRHQRESGYKSLSSSLEHGDA